VQISEFIPDLGVTDSGSFVLDIEENGDSNKLLVSFVFHRGNTFYYAMLGKQDTLYAEFTNWLGASSGMTDKICNDTLRNNIEFLPEQLDKPIVFRSQIVGEDVPRIIEVDLFRSVRTAYEAIFPRKNSNLRVRKKLDDNSCMVKVNGKSYQLLRKTYAVYPVTSSGSTVKMNPFDFSANLVTKSGNIGDFIKLETVSKEIIFERDDL